MSPAVWPPDLTLQADSHAMFDQDTADRVTTVGRIRYPGTISSVEFIPNWSLTGTDTNFRTLSLINRGTAGLGNTTIATLALTSGVNLTKFIAKTIPITAANATVVVGDTLEWVTTATLTGAPDPGGRVIVQQAVTY